ncbi:MAG: hypothetical protein HYR70_04135 [Chloroflexi bacterium]|nr:hypothetical protein [Chloroflexota bacterium]MBI3340745.1 hypothetical protein [Chloroflexota bacterium]
MNTQSNFDLSDLTNRLSEIGGKLSADQRNLIEQVSNNSHPDCGVENYAENYAKIWDELQAKSILMAQIKLRREEIDAELLGKLGKKGFARYQKERASRRQTHGVDYRPDPQLNELQNILHDIRNGAISFRQLLPFLLSVISRKIKNRYALPDDECGPFHAALS